MHLKVVAVELSRLVFIGNVEIARNFWIEAFGSEASRDCWIFTDRQ